MNSKMYLFILATIKILDGLEYLSGSAHGRIFKYRSKPNIYTMIFYEEQKNNSSRMVLSSNILRSVETFCEKLNKMSIEFYYIGCHRPIVLSSLSLEVDKIFRNKMSLNMSILYSLPRRMTTAPSHSSGKSLLVPSRNSNKKGNAKIKKNKCPSNHIKTMNPTIINPFLNYHSKEEDSPAIDMDNFFKTKTSSLSWQSPKTDTSILTRLLFS